MRKFLSFLFLGLVIGFFPLHAADLNLVGAGGTFVYPLFSKLFDVYHTQYGIGVNYQPIGSGGGQLQLVNRTVDFADSDVYMTDEQMAKAHSIILNIPVCLGAVALTYNLPGNPALRLNSEVITKMFLGEITQWNDSQIQRLNVGVTLPNLSIITVHRSEGSGTTNIFTDYLSKVSSQWRKRVGEGLSVAWPSGLAAKGNAGVAGLVRQTPGSFSYVELAYAMQNHMSIASIENQKGKYIFPSLNSTTAAGHTPRFPADTRVLVTDSPNASAYPIAGFTWLLVYKELHYGNQTRDKAKALVHLIWWITHEGQKFTEPLLYAPLPANVVSKVNRLIASITFDGKPVIYEK